VTTAELMATVPPLVRVGPFDFAVVIITSDYAKANDLLGEFCSDAHEIRLKATYAGNHIAVDTFIHEIAHAIFWVYHLADGDSEERVVSLTSTAWTQVYRDNPDVLGWIARGLHA